MPILKKRIGDTNTNINFSKLLQYSGNIEKSIGNTSNTNTILHAIILTTLVVRTDTKAYGNTPTLTPIDLKHVEYENMSRNFKFSRQVAPL